ncbi:MAG: PHP domain-containing protein [Christensenellaceae bacterium]|jgi:predicted metal-dependent phosphoesterase TrpH|nr:PHP domain-containing protein [Christensenellaceae bacterium]
MKVDLHSHTTYSDGTQTVSELLTKAERAGLGYLAITDHQSVGAHKELEKPEVRKLFSGKIIPGIELEFDHHGICNEVLGLCIDTDKVAKLDFLQDNEKKRRRLFYLRNLYDMFVGVGFKAKPYEVYLDEMTKTGIMPYTLVKKIYNDPENQELANSLGLLKAATRYSFFRTKVDDPKSKYYAQQIIETLAQVCNAIHGANGLAFMAHPFRANKDNQANALEPDVLKMLDYVVKNKLLDGLEVYRNDHTAEQTTYLEKYVKKHNLLASGGSDNHYPPEPIADFVPAEAVTWLK